MIQLLNKDQINFISNVVISRITDDVQQHNKEITESAEYKQAIDSLELRPDVLELTLAYEGFVALFDSEYVKDEIRSHFINEKSTLKAGPRSEINSQFGLIDDYNSWDIKREVDARLSLQEVDNFDTIVNNMVSLMKDQFKIYA